MKFSAHFLLCLAALPAMAESLPLTGGQTWHVDTSLNYSRGNYGFTEDTEVSLGLLTVTSENARWRFQGLVPALTLKGPATVVAGVGQAGRGPTRPESTSETGVGDLVLGATRKFGAVLGAIHLDLGAQLKLPTANERKGLGTGETDFTVQADVRQSLGSITPFATVGFRFLGSNARYPLENGFFASLGVVRVLTPATSVGVSYNWRQKVLRGADNSSEALGFFLHQLNERWRVQGYGLVGFSDASPDFGAGLSLGYRF